MDECKDHFITWEKNYKRDGWDEAAPSRQFDELKERNNNEDLRRYRFDWQEHPWPRGPRFQRLIVRATNPEGRQIQVAIVTSDSNRDRRCVIGTMFNRWLQENDFGYMNRHPLEHSTCETNHGNDRFLLRSGTPIRSNPLSTPLTAFPNRATSFFIRRLSLFGEHVAIQQHVHHRGWRRTGNNAMHRRRTSHGKDRIVRRLVNIASPR